MEKTTHNPHRVLAHVMIPEDAAQGGLRLVASCIDYGVPEENRFLLGKKTCESRIAAVAL